MSLFSWSSHWDSSIMDFSSHVWVWIRFKLWLDHLSVISHQPAGRTHVCSPGVSYLVLSSVCVCVCEAEPVEASPPPLVGYRFLLQVWLPEQLNNQYISSADKLDSFWDFQSCDVSTIKTEQIIYWHPSSWKVSPKCRTICLMSRFISELLITTHWFQPPPRYSDDAWKTLYWSLSKSLMKGN